MSSMSAAPLAEPKEASRRILQFIHERIAALRLDRKLTSGRLIDTITNDNFKVPTTIAAFGQSLYAVNARFGEPNPQTLDYTVVKASVR